MLTTLLFALPLAWAEPLVIDGAVADRTFSCEEGRDVTIQGAALQITLTGSCGTLSVVGSSNQVTVDGVARVVVEGSSNKVTWSRDLSGEAKLPVSTTGVRNKVKQGAR